ncbi:unnamed protein product [Lasius platythorax]|uniref:Uncharacterized protein n=1 Tax=Lasius platythorax TaxID=488582 RepID=A0AAV2NYM9_9HYME
MLVDRLNTVIFRLLPEFPTPFAKEARRGGGSYSEIAKIVLHVAKLRYGVEYTFDYNDRKSPVSSREHDTEIKRDAKIKRDKRTTNTEKSCVCDI